MSYPLIGNPLQNQDFHIPLGRRDQLRAISQQQGGDDPTRVRGEDLPFARMVDAWLLAVALGYANGDFARVGDGGVELKKVMSLSVLNNNPRAVAFLMHVAVAHEKDAYVIQEPARVAQVADSYAVGGFEQLFSMLSSGNGNKMLTLSESLIDQFRPTPVEDASPQP